MVLYDINYLFEFADLGLRIFYEKIYKRYRILIPQKKVKKVAKIFGKGIEKNTFVNLVTNIKTET